MACAYICAYAARTGPHHRLIVTVPTGTPKKGAATRAVGSLRPPAYPVAPGLAAVAADVHRAPGARSILRPVVERPAALAAGLQPGPRPLEHRRVRCGENHAEAAVDARALRLERQTAVAADGQGQPGVPRSPLELRLGGGRLGSARVCRPENTERLPQVPGPARIPVVQWSTGVKSHPVKPESQPLGRREGVLTALEVDGVHQRLDDPQAARRRGASARKVVPELRAKVL